MVSNHKERLCILVIKWMNQQVLMHPMKQWAPIQTKYGESFKSPSVIWCKYCYFWDSCHIIIMMKKRNSSILRKIYLSPLTSYCNSGFIVLQTTTKTQINYQIADKQYANFSCNAQSAIHAIRAVLPADTGPTRAFWDALWSGLRNLTFFICWFSEWSENEQLLYPK